MRARVLLAALALIAAFGVAYAAGSATKTHASAPAGKLAQSASVSGAGAHPTVVAVTPAQALPALKLGVKKPAHHATHAPAAAPPPVTTPVSTPTTSAPVQTPTVSHPVSPPAPVVQAPAPSAPVVHTPAPAPTPTHTSTGSSGTGVGSGGG